MKNYDRYSVYQILDTPISLFGGTKTKDKINALQWMRDKAEFDDLEYIYPLIFEKKTELGLAAAEIVKDIMVKITEKQWENIYDRLKYLKIDKDKLATLLKYPEKNSVHLLGIATLNSNGYVREKSLRILSGIITSNAVPYVLLRLSDWVEPIRKISYHILRNTLTIDNIDSFIVNFYLVDKLKYILRVDLNIIREEVISFLKDESVICRIKYHLRHSNVKTRLFCYNILLERLSTDKDIVNSALTDRSFEVRLWLVGALDKLEYKEKLEVIKVLRHDKSAKVKVALLRRAEQTIIRDLKEYILEMVCDEHTAPREEARYVARKYLLLDDIINFYRERVKKQPSVGNILGLGEMGNEKDYALISEFALSEDPKIKCAAIKAMWCLSRDASVEYILNCLESNIPKVRKTAKRLLKTSKMYLVLSKMKEKLRQDESDMKIYALEVIYRHGGWQALENILWVISHEDGEALRHANKILERWLRKTARFYTRLDNDMAKIINEYIEIIKEKHRISDKELKELEFITQTRK